MFRQITAGMGKFGDLVLAGLVVAIIGLLIIPLPSPVVDLLIATNICISTVLLMLSLYLPRALAFSTFPSMLLFTTLFRLVSKNDYGITGGHFCQKRRKAHSCLFLMVAVSSY